MDHILQLHVEVEHHSRGGGSSPSLEGRGAGGVARFGKGVGDAPRAVFAFAAIIASLALLFSPSFFSSLLTARTALFVLSNAIFALLAADCRWFFSAASASDIAVDACEQRHGRWHHQIQEEARQCAVQPCVPYYSAGCLGHENSSGTASEASTEPAMASDSTTELEDMPPATSSRLELLRRPDGGDNISVETAAVDEQEPTTCETRQGLDELGIDELNRKFDEFIQSRRNRWVEEAYLQCDFQL